MDDENVVDGGSSGPVTDNHPPADVEIHSLADSDGGDDDAATPLAPAEDKYGFSACCPCVFVLMKSVGALILMFLP